MKIGSKLLTSLILVPLFGLLLAIFLYSAYQLAGIVHNYSESRTSFEEIRRTAVTPNEQPDATRAPGSPNSPAVIRESSPLIVDFTELQNQNADVRAWLFSPDTRINYPVVQGPDNSFYLHRLMDKSYNPGGTLFIDYRCEKDFTSKNTLIYGHHMNDGSMFASIVEYKDQQYYDDHPVMYLNTPEQNYRMDIVCGFVTYYDSRVYTIDFASRTEFDDWFTLMRGYSDFVSDVEVESDDRLVTLSTCTYDYDNARYVLLAKLVPID